MFRHTFPIILMAASVGLAMNNAHALPPEIKVKVAPATTPDAFAAQAKEVRESMDPGGRYDDISHGDRQRVEADMAQITKLLQKRGSADQLNEKEQTDLINAQEQANALLTENDGDRLICRYERKVGTHFREKTCQTASELAHNRENTIKTFHDQTLIRPATGSDGG